MVTYSPRRHQLGGDLDDLRGGDPGDQVRGPPRVHLDGDIGQERRRQLGGHLRRSPGLEQPGQPSRQQRSEHALAHRGAESDGQQPAGRGQPAQRPRMGIEQRLGQALAQLSQILHRQWLEVGQRVGLALQQARQLHHLGLRLQRLGRPAHPTTLRIGPRSRRGTRSSARSPDAARAWPSRWRASLIGVREIAKLGFRQPASALAEHLHRAGGAARSAPRSPSRQAVCLRNGIRRLKKALRGYAPIGSLWA